ncbi:hypothetical protein HQQ94_13435 [Shewanella sp. VB17]|nr:hypothetical protein [Shewanella sp. VB17]NRD74220.1 hypothetical protein [Shewanella sp. VB17]
MTNNIITNSGGTDIITVIMSVIGFSILAAVTVAFGMALYQEWQAVKEC